MESSEQPRIGTEMGTGAMGMGAMGRGTARGERNLLPVGVAAAVVLLLVVLLWVLSGRGRRGAVAGAEYAKHMTLSNLAMSESSNLAGGKVTYLDGEVANTGDRTVTGVTVRVEFRNASREVVQNETMALNLIRMREPYIDTEPVSAAPLKAGERRDFRLIFDQVSADWDEAYPEVQVLGATTR